jgi:uncharacterized protein (DUF2236 family)
MRNLGLRLLVPALALAVALFHTEVFAQFSSGLGATADAPTYLKWVAVVAVVALLAVRRLR